MKSLFGEVVEIVDKNVSNPKNEGQSKDQKVEVPRGSDAPSSNSQNTSTKFLLNKMQSKMKEQAKRAAQKAQEMVDRISAEYQEKLDAQHGEIDRLKASIEAQK